VEESPPRPSPLPAWTRYNRGAPPEPPRDPRLYYPPTAPAPHLVLAATATMVRTYPSMSAMQVDSAQLAPFGWWPANVQQSSHTNTAGLVALIIGVIVLFPFCGIGLLLLFALPGLQSTTVIATYYLNPATRTQPPGASLPTPATRRLSPTEIAKPLPYITPPLEVRDDYSFRARVRDVDAAIARYLPGLGERISAYVVFALLTLGVLVSGMIWIAFLVLPQ
jgi:hypothetical protein